MQNLVGGLKWQRRHVGYFKGDASAQTVRRVNTSI